MAKTTKKNTAATDPAPYHKGNVAEDLFSVASTLLEKEGLEALSVRRLCREVGVTAGNFYNHYPSLEYLLLEVAAQGFEKLDAAVKRAGKKASSNHETISIATATYVDFSQDHPDLFRIMFGQIPNVDIHPRFVQASARAFAGLIAMIYGEDIYRPDDVAWSHQHCRKGYALLAFAYGLARALSMKLITIPSGTKGERRQFVQELTQTFILGLDRAK